MRKIYQRRVGLSLVVITFIAVIVWQVWGMSTAAQPLSESDAKMLVETRYSEEIIDITLVNGVYKVRFRLETGTYELRIDRASGDVIEIIKVMLGEVTSEKTEAEMKVIIEQQKSGTLKKLEKRMDGERAVYDAVLEDDGKKIMLTLSAETGEVVAKQVEKEKAAAVGITEAEAVKIALDTVAGDVDDIDYEEEDGVFYYFIEIEQKNDREAEIKINAITGKVINISWD